ncbi:hypothetical protein GALL_113870 [mine drainage metagenome]|uniref:Uncharacterized protein n=1 Tax=mine drainage metagenome TaxID=410659 RepID=A0A1J5T2S0_9ZZZZ
MSTAPLISSAANRALASIADALAEKDARRRNRLISVALEQWASEDVEAAGAWSLAPTGLPRNVALAAVIRGGVGAHPLATARYVGRLSVECPDEADELGHDLIFALGKNGLWSAAAAWATGGAQVNPEWISDAYARWSAARPEEAQASAAALASPPAREAALSAIVPANPRSS